MTDPDDAWREHDMLDSARYAYEQLMSTEYLLERRRLARDEDVDRWKLMYHAPVHPQGWVCPDCYSGKHHCRHPIYDPSMENQERCICCGQERDGRD